jgi:hypothetical protein
MSRPALRWLAPLAGALVLGAPAAPASAASLGSILGGVLAPVATLVTKADSAPQVAQLQQTVNGLLASTGVADLVAACGPQETSKVFLPWGDIADYAPAPQGDVESGSAWTFGSGASFVAANSPFSAGQHALALGSGGDAVSPVACLDVVHPTLRLFARNTGSSASRLNVDVLFVDLTGHASSVRVASLSGGSAWAPTDIIPLVANAFALTSNTGTTAVAFHLSVSGAGSWQLDDLEIDPWKSR